MYAYYINNGHTLESLLSLNSYEHMFYAEAMLWYVEKNNVRCPLSSGK